MTKMLFKYDTFEFPLNVFTEFSEFSGKLKVIKVKGPNLPPSHLFCKRPAPVRLMSKTN